MTFKKFKHALAIFGVVLIANAALGDENHQNVRKKNIDGFSEIAVPQISGTIPLAKSPAASSSSRVGKIDANEAPNQPVNCGPDNAQSVACQSRGH